MLLFELLGICLVCYLVFWAMGYLGAPDPIRKVATVIIVFVVVIWLFAVFLPGLMPGAAVWHWK